MAEAKLEFLKEKLEEQGLVDEQWGSWLEQASMTCSAAQIFLKKFEPYALLTIQALKDAEEYLVGLKEELEEA